jgi:hypothetical protein
MSTDLLALAIPLERGAQEHGMDRP